ncbi:MAG: hypothetical protein KJ025_15030 [Burkholderiales bacterium]|nr:hypothetical protein [Burkholderiales bacterium]
MAETRTPRIQSAVTLPAGGDPLHVPKWPFFRLAAVDAECDSQGCTVPLFGSRSVAFPVRMKRRKFIVSSPRG